MGLANATIDPEKITEKGAKQVDPLVRLIVGIIKDGGEDVGSEYLSYLHKV